MRHLLLLLLLFLPLPVLAQDEDGGGFLTRMIERQLSSDDQQVRLTGFQGVLSSRASFARLTIADRNGVWLTIEGAQLDWDRSALLRGELVVTELSARVIDLDRLPPGGEGGGTTLPSPTSTSVNLPSLPVGIHIGRIAAEKVRLGPSILGEELLATVEGSLELADGEGAADISAVRTDGTEGRLVLDAAFANESRNLRIAVELAEAEGGVLAHMLGLPGEPSVDFTIRGEAPISDFAADIRLETAGAPRVTGTLRFMDLPENRGLGWALDLSGDVAPLFDAPYRPFFGDSAQLGISGQNLSGGGTRLDRLEVHSEELDLSGTLSMAADGMPDAFDLTGAIRPTGGTTVLLPVSGGDTRIGAATIRATYDAAAGDRFTLETGFRNFSSGGTAIGEGRLAAAGTISRDGGRAVAADVTLDVAGLELADPAVSAALGQRLAGKMTLGWSEGGSLALTDADLTAGTARFTGAATFSGLGGNLRIETDATLAASDLLPYSQLAGMTLGGAAEASLRGFYEPLGGAFDLTLDARTTGLQLATGLLNDLAGGDGSFAGRLARGPEGTTFDNLRIETRQVSALLSGTLGSETGDVTLDARLADFGLVYAGMPGPATAKGTLGRSGQTLRFNLDGELPRGIALLVTGTALADFSVADVTLDGTVAEISALVPQLSGPVAAKGAVRLADRVLSLDLTTDGPEGAALELDGTYALATGLADMAVKGTADLGIADRFTGGQAEVSGQAVLDLRLNGPAAPGSLGGTLKAKGARIVLPSAGITLPDADLVIALDPDHPAMPEALLAADLSAVLRGIEAPGAAWLPLVQGPVTLDSRVALRPGTKIALRDLSLTNGDARVTGTADVDPGEAGQATAALHVALADLARLRPLVPLDLSGATGADLDLTYTFADGVLEAALDGQATGLSLGSGPVFALLDPATAYAATARMQGDRLAVTGLRLDNGNAGVTGTVDVTGLGAQPVVAADLRVTLGGLSRFSALAGMPLGGSADATVKATYRTADGSLDATVAGGLSGLRLGSGTVNDLLGGDARFTAGVAMRGGTLTVQDGSFRNAALDVAADYQPGRLDLRATLDSLGRLVPQLPGPLTVQGSVGIGDGYALDLSASGPGGISARVSGPVSAALVPDLRISGTAPLGIANVFLPDSINTQGDIAADLTMAGELGLGGLGGAVNVSNGRVAIAGTSLALEGLSARVALGGGQARVEAETGFNTSGRAALSGSIGLTGAMPVDMGLTLSRVEVVQAPTVRTSLNGQLDLSGSIRDGGLLSGRIELGETEVSLAFGGAAGGDLLEVRHVGEPPASLRTRARAGLLEPEGSGGGGGGTGRLRLDVVISAPNQIFVRGRGLDAELGGELRITGRAGAIVPSGAFQLVRGRMDLLGHRLELSEGWLELQGNFDPALRLVASTTAEDVNVQIVTEGTASKPTITLTSSPDLPQEELLALLLFGKGIDTISAIQALQLANAVRTLLSGSEGVQGRLRQQFGLDELDLTTDADGNVAVRAGKYISENVYVDTGVDTSGNADIRLNLDITPSLTARGKVGSSGETSLGIFFERDY